MKALRPAEVNSINDRTMCLLRRYRRHFDLFMSFKEPETADSGGSEPLPSATFVNSVVAEGVLRAVHDIVNTPSSSCAPFSAVSVSSDATGTVNTSAAAAAPSPSQLNCRNYLRAVCGSYHTYVSGGVDDGGSGRCASFRVARGLGTVHTAGDGDGSRSHQISTSCRYPGLYQYCHRTESDTGNQNDLLLELVSACTFCFISLFFDEAETTTNLDSRAAADVEVGGVERPSAGSSDTTATATVSGMPVEDAAFRQAVDDTVWSARSVLQSAAASVIPRIIATIRHSPSLTDADADAASSPSPCDVTEETEIALLVDVVRVKWQYIFTEVLGAEGISRLLRLRNTVGSRQSVARGILPPPPSVLLASFTRLHGKIDTKCQDTSKLLTVGARALAKHCHRDVSDSWWLNPPVVRDGSDTDKRKKVDLKGGNDKKNALALDVLQRILFDATWVNVHVLPHDIVTFEVRCCLGYGARWVLLPITTTATSTTTSTLTIVDCPVVESPASRSAVTVSAEKEDPPSGVSEGRGDEEKEDGDTDGKKGGGYDARTFLVEFRGFLEPHDPDGHSQGWCH